MTWSLSNKWTCTIKKKNDVSREITTKWNKNQLIRDIEIYSFIDFIISTFSSLPECLVFNSIL